MRSADLLFLSKRCRGGVVKRANIIDVPDMAKAVRRPPQGIAGFAASAPAGMRHGGFYSTGERQFSNVKEPSLLGATGNTLRGAGQAALSPLLGVFHAGGNKLQHQSLLGGLASHGTDAVMSAATGNFRNAGKYLTQMGRDINPWNSKGTWSQAIQRHANKGVQDVTQQIPHWWNFPGGFWEQAGGQANRGTSALGNTNPF